MATVMEVLDNALFNLQGGFMAALAEDQLSNAIALLEKGYSIHDEADELLLKYGSAEDVPDKDVDDNG